MKIEYKTRVGDSTIQFQDLDIGETFTDIDYSGLYIKTNDKECNAFCLVSNGLFYIEPKDEVIKVDTILKINSHFDLNLE